MVEPKGTGLGAPLGLGVVGAGRFAAFCLPAYQALSEVKVVAVADPDVARARTLAPPGARVYADYGALLEDPDVAIVVISTPPCLHGPQACDAARAGKHALVEKPLATSPEEAERAVRASQEAGVKLTVNYVLRHHPLHRLAREVVRSRALGDLQHVSLVNLATDDGLPPGHWFWDRSQSGGIHVEHGVHFFDLVNQLVGALPDGVAGGDQRRPDGRVDRAWAVVRYQEGVLATFYHSFSRPRCIERTTMGISLSRGEIVLEGWIPTRLELFGLVDEAGLATLQALVGTQLVVRTGDGPEIEVKARIEAPDRQREYRRAVQASLRDLVGAIREGRSPEVTPADALASLAVAWAATHVGAAWAPIPRITDAFPTSGEPL